MRLIDADAAIDALKEHRALYCDNTPETFSKLSYVEKSRVDELDTAIATLVNLPSAQPKHKKGRWLPDNRPGGGFWVCSECKFPSEAFAANVLYKFCPNCGADMRGEAE